MTGYILWAVWSIGKLPFGYKYFVEPWIFPEKNKLEQVVDSSLINPVEKDSTLNLREDIRKKNEEYFESGLK